MSAVRTRLLLAVAPLLILSLSGCSTKSGIGLLATSPNASPTAEVDVVPAAQPPSVLSTGFDRFAGNCADAANEDTALINYAASQNYTFDMQLRIQPTQGCDADTHSGAYKTFIRAVGQATLTMNAIDTGWVYGYTATRDTFLTNVFSQLQAHYPSLSRVSVTVTYGGQTRATLTYNGHGQPVLQDLYAQ